MYPSIRPSVSSSIRQSIHQSVRPKRIFFADGLFRIYELASGFTIAQSRPSWQLHFSELIDLVDKKAFRVGMQNFAAYRAKLQKAGYSNLGDLDPLHQEDFVAPFIMPRTRCVFVSSVDL